MGRSTAETALSRLLSSLGSALLLVLCCCCCSCDARPVHSFSPRVMSGSCSYSPGARELGCLSWQRRAASFCSVWVGGMGCRGGNRRSRALATATARGAMLARRRASEDRDVGGRGVWMKANKKNKRKRERRQANDSGMPTSSGGRNHALMYSDTPIATPV